MSAKREFPQMATGTVALQSVLLACAHRTR